jgi:aminoglycoside phosphotransferase (APT) family kinase protein
VTVGPDGRSWTSSPVALDPALNGDLGHGAVRRLAADPLGHGVAEVVGSCLPDAPSWSWELVRSKYKPARKLTAYYRVASPGSGDDRHVAVTWFADRQPAPWPDAAEPPSARLSAASEDGRISVRICPDDPAMPQLARLTDPEHLAVLLGGRSGRPVAAGRLAVDTVRYRPGQRHVLRVRLDGGAWVYVKTDRDRSGERAVATAAYLRERVPDGARGAAVAVPLEYDAEDSAALWWNTPGVPLSRQLATRPAAALRVVAQTGRALRVLHDSPSGPESLPRRSGPEGVHAEARETLRAGEHVAALLPDVGRTFEQVVAEVVEGLDRVPEGSAVLSHGDFKSDNLVVDDSRLTILDLDRSAWADPAKDLAKFLVDLRWWCPDQGRAAALAVAFRAGYGTCDDERWARARLFAALFQLKLTARRCAVHDAAWETQVRARVGDAVETLRAARGA